MAIIQCGILSWKILFLCLVPITVILVRVIPFSFMLYSHYLMINVFNNGGITLFSLLNLVRIIKGYSGRAKKSEMSKTLSTYTRITLSEKFEIIKKSKGQYLIYAFLVLEGIVDSILGLLLNLYKNNPDNLHVITQYIQLPFISMLCFLVLDYQYFRHHYISLLISLIGVIIIFSITFPSVKSWGEFFFSVFFYFIQVSFDVWDKWVMERRNISPFTILLYEGVIGIIMSLLMIVIFSHLNCEGIFLTVKRFCTKDQPVASFAMFKPLVGSKIILSIIGYIIFIGLFYLSCKLTNYYFTPTHRKMVDIIGTFGGWIRVLIVYPKEFPPARDVALILIGYVIIILGILFFSEILVFYKWNMEWNTQKEIMKRASEEQLRESLSLMSECELKNLDM